jgi:hypothetical protein
MTHTQELLDACRFAADSLHVFRGNANPACITNAIERLESAISTAGSTDTALLQSLQSLVSWTDSLDEQHLTWDALGAIAAARAAIAKATT